MPKTFRAKIILQMLLISLIPLLIMVVVVYAVALNSQEFASESIDDSRDTLQQETVGVNKAGLAWLLSYDMETWIAQRIENVRSWARDGAVINAAKEEADSTSARLFLGDEIVGKPDFADAYIVSLTGDLVTREISYAQPDIESDGASWRLGKEQGLYVGDLYMPEDGFSNVFSMDIAVLVNDLITGDPLGVLVGVVKVHPASLGQEFEVKVVDHRIMVFDRSGMIVVNTDSDNRFLEENPVWADAEQQVLDRITDDAVIIEPNYVISDDVVAGYARATNDSVDLRIPGFDGLGWTVMVEQDADTAFAALESMEQLEKDLDYNTRSALFMSIVIFAAVAISVLGLAFWISRIFTKPILKLQQGVQEVMEGNLDHRINLDRSDELGKLSSAFDEMAVNLQQSQRKLQRYAGQLEGMVRHRTAELERSEEKLRLMFESIRELMCVTDPLGTVMEANQAALDLTGYSRDEFIGMNIAELLAESQRDELITIMMQNLAEGEATVNLQCAFKIADGSEIEMESSSSVLHDRSGKSLGFITVARDITERKRMEEELRESEKRYRLLADNAADVIFTLDMDFNYTYVSPSVERMRGFTPEELAGLSVEQTMTPDSFEIAAKLLAEEIEIEKQEDKNLHRMRTLELELYGRNGSTIWAEVSVTFLREEDGKAIEIMGVARDITERKQMENALQESEEKLRSIFECIPDGITVTDVEGNGIDVNPALLRILGFGSKEEALSRKGLESVVQKDRARVVEDTLVAMESPQGAKEYTFVRADGSEFEGEAIGSVLKDSSGKPTGFISVIRDITERKRAEEELQKLALIIKHSSELVNLSLPDGKMVFLNEAGSRMLGINPDEVEQTNIMEVIPDRFKEMAQDELLPSLVNNGSWEGDLQYLNLKTGEITDVYAITFSIKDQDTGQLLYLANVSSDITERKRIEQELKKNEEKFRAIFENTLDEIILLDKNGIILDRNVKGENIIGYTLEEVQGRNFADFGFSMSEEQMVSMLRSFNKAELGEGGRGLIDLELKHKNGKTILAQASLSFIKKNGEFEGLICVLRDITESKRMEEEIKESEAGLRQAQQIAHVGSWELNLRDGSFFMSEEMRHIYGLEENDSYSSFQEITERVIHPDDREIVSKAIQDVAEGILNPITFRIVRPNGELRWITSVPPSVKHQDEGDNSLTIIGVVQDITERKQAEEELRESEEKFRGVVEQANDIICIVQEGLVRYINQRALDILGYSPEEMVDTIVSDYIHPDAVESIMSLYAETHEETAEASMLETALLCKDGRRVEAEINVSIIQYESKNADLVIIRDITERKRAADALRESEEKFRMIFDLSPEAIVLIDPNGNFLNMNGRLLDWLSYDPSEVIGVNLADIPFFTVEGKTTVIDNFMRRMNGEEVGPYELDFLAKSGEIRIGLITAQPLEDDEGKLMYDLVIVSDITERKRVEEELHKLLADLARSNEELQQFAYIASHDLQEPLRMISSYTQLLARRYKGILDTEADDFINYAVDGAARMQAMINALLDYSRVGTRGKQFEPVDSETVFENALYNLEILIEENEAVVTHDPLPPVVADKTQIGQLLQNLIGNAIKFHDEELPRIHVSSVRQGEEWIFSVSDNGIGIESQYADRIFEIFQRLHTKAEYPGTGIGLSVCRKIVERHGGRIWMESEPGKGTTFYFTIPIRVREETPV